MQRPVRRIVTGHDDNGKAVVVQDSMIEPIEIRGGAAFFTKAWTTATSPADNDDPADGALRDTGLTLEGGSVLRFVDMAPGTETALHRTNSLDYAIVLEGGVELELDDKKTVRLAAGDMVVQRGTIHAWRNAGPDWTRMLFVMIDANPATIGGAPLPPISGSITTPRRA